MISDTTCGRPGHERRASARRRVLKAGRIVFNEGYSTLACTVRDFSATGARLRIEGAIVIPDTFDLIVEIDGLVARCDVVARRAGEVAVRFLAPPRTVTPTRSQVVRPLGTSRPAVPGRRLL